MLTVFETSRARAGLPILPPWEIERPLEVDLRATDGPLAVCSTDILRPSTARRAAPAAITIDGRRPSLQAIEHFASAVSRLRQSRERSTVRGEPPQNIPVGKAFGQ